MVFRRLVGLGLLVGAILGAVFLWPVVSADSNGLSDDHIDRIRSNCVSAKHSLTQLHANDGLLRVNRGQIYEALSVKLMVPMNSRITLNRLDGGDMVNITASYDQELASFRSNYQVYERQLSSVMRINCDSSPEKFYEAVKEASESRKAVHGSVVALHEHIREYQKAFDDFAREFEENVSSEDES